MTKIVLVGNPNTGKTTLFNTITKAHEKVANYSGVTVEEKIRKIKVKDQTFEVVDLPGLYSVNALGDDESVTRKFIDQNKDALYIFVASALDIQKNINLLYELSSLKLKLGVFVNAYNVKASEINESLLEQYLKVPVLVQNATKGRSKILGWIEAVDRLDAYISGFDLEKVRQICNIEITEQKIDKFLLHPIYGKIFFVATILSILIISMILVDKFVGKIVEEKWQNIGNIIAATLLKYNLPIIASFVSSVLVSSVGAVITFLPELFVILFCMYLLEETGYLPRVATLFNFSLSKIGLNGQSVFSLCLGVGCTTTGVIASRNVQNKSIRCKTMQLLPFVGCSAKLPIILYLASRFLPSIGIAVLLFLIVVIMGIVVVRLTDIGQSEPMVIELPRLRMPSIKQLIKKSLSLILEFSIRVFSTLLIVSSLIWILGLIKLGVNKTSLIEYAGEFLKFLLVPLGLNDKACSIALLTGLVAKENILATLAMFGKTEFFGAQAVSFITFVLLYPPCIPALKCVRIEFGRAYQIRMFIRQLVLAYIVATINYTLSSYIGIVFGIIVSTLICIFGIIIYAKLFMNTKKRCSICKLSA